LLIFLILGHAVAEAVFLDVMTVINFINYNPEVLCQMSGTITDTVLIIQLLYISSLPFAMTAIHISLSQALQWSMSFNATESRNPACIHLTSTPIMCMPFK